VREEFQRVCDHARLIEERAALGAVVHVRAQGRDAEADFSVEQQVYFVGQQVAVLHWYFLLACRTGRMSLGFQGWGFGPSSALIP
jgi:hypothetical protein